MEFHSDEFPEFPEFHSDDNLDFICRELCNYSDEKYNEPLSEKINKKLFSLLWSFKGKDNQVFLKECYEYIDYYKKPNYWSYSSLKSYNPGEDTQVIINLVDFIPQTNNINTFNNKMSLIVEYPCGTQRIEAELKPGIYKHSGILANLNRLFSGYLKFHSEGEKTVIKRASKYLNETNTLIFSPGMAKCMGFRETMELHEGIVSEEIEKTFSLTLNECVTETFEISNETIKSIQIDKFKTLISDLKVDIPEYLVDGDVMINFNFNF